MPALAALIIGALSWAVRGLVARVLVHLGLGVVTYVGMGVLIGKFSTFITQQIGGLPADVFAVTQLLGVTTMVNMVITAVTVKLTLGGLFDGSFSKWFVKGS
jgi:hypothetical protein